MYKLKFKILKKMDDELNGTKREREWMNIPGNIDDFETCWATKRIKREQEFLPSLSEIEKYMTHSEQKVKNYQLEADLIKKDREIAKLRCELAEEKCQKIITKDDYNEMVETVNRNLQKLQEAIQKYAMFNEELKKNVSELNVEIRKIKNQNGLILYKQTGIKETVDKQAKAKL